jgi:hypothetical protein
MRHPLETHRTARARRSDNGVWDSSGPATRNPRLGSTRERLDVNLIGPSAKLNADPSETDAGARSAEFAVEARCRHSGKGKFCNRLNHPEDCKSVGLDLVQVTKVYDFQAEYEGSGPEVEDTTPSPRTRAAPLSQLRTKTLAVWVGSAPAQRILRRMGAQKRRLLVGCSRIRLPADKRTAIQQ